MDDRLPTFATCPRYVRAVDFGHVLVLVDYRTGRAQCLLPPAGFQWQSAARTGALDTLDTALAHQLLELGLLVPSRTPLPWPTATNGRNSPSSWGSTEHPAGTRRPARGPLTATLTAAAALAATFAATRHGATDMQQVLTLLDTASARTVRPATIDQATAAVGAVRHASWYSPGRTACLEGSVAAVLLLAARRLGVRWCHGIASDPIRLHAWVQTMDGANVAEPSSTRAYTPVLTLGGHHHHPH